MKRNILLLALSVISGITLSSCNGIIDPSLLEVMADGGTIFADDDNYEYDSAGIPVFGYDGGQAVYGYAEDSTPIYDYSSLTSRSTIPAWGPENTSVNYRGVGRRSTQPPTGAHNRHGNLKHRGNRAAKRRGGNHQVRRTTEEAPMGGYERHRGINLDAPANSDDYTEL